MMFRSIRVSLAFWLAVILLASIAVLGVVLHRELRATLYRECDAQLENWVSAVRAIQGAPAAGQSLSDRVRTVLPEAARYAVFGVDGRLLAESTAPMEWSVPTRAATVTVDHYRWRHAVGGRGQGWILVGRSVRDENHSIRQFLITLLVTSSGIVLLTCAGGFVLASRVLAPTKAIAATAQRIAAKQLDERIDVERVPAELRPMAVTLNESFARIETAFATQAAFTADASHELRTPLAVIVAHLELAAMHIGDPEDVAERLRICQAAALRIERIVNGLLTLARADAGSVSPPYVPIELGELVREHVQAMTPLAAARDVSIEVSGGQVFVHGCRDQLGEVVVNLLDNAIRYNRPSGTVTISIAYESQHAVLRVADSGIGLTDEQLPKVFGRFYRADASRSRSDGSSGLGLAIIRSIVEQHGGTIAVEQAPAVEQAAAVEQAPAVDRATAGGCEFVVRLPRLTSAASGKS